MGIFARSRRPAGALARLREERGLSIAEAMIAMVVLLVGVLGTFMLIQTASAGDSKVRAREGATNLAREILEEARSTRYPQIGKPEGWLDQKLTALPGREGAVTAPSAASRQVTVSRRGYSYTVSVSWCSVDDARDGYGAHAPETSYCPDSTGTGSADGQPEDLKRVAVRLSYALNGAPQPQLVQTASFGSSGVAIGPETSSLALTAPSGLSPPYVIASSPPGDIVSFLATSAGANDMRFAVEGQEQAGGVVNNLNGSWTFNWNIAALKDGTYTIAATAIDVLGSRGQPRSIQVTLARGAPVAPQSPTGGYNQNLYDGSPAAKKTVVELEWAANPEGSVTGYSVERESYNETLSDWTYTVVSGCAQSYKTACIDQSPASYGSTTYRVKTHYTNAAGNPAWVSTSYSVSAPAGSSLPSTYYFTSTTNYVANCATGLAGNHVDLKPTAPTGLTVVESGSQFFGCMQAFATPPVQLGPGTVTFTGWFTNTGSKDCFMTAYITKADGSTLNFGQNPSLKIPRGWTTPTLVTETFPSRSITQYDPGARMWVYLPVSHTTDCGKTTFRYNSTTYPSRIELPLSGGGGSTLATPGIPTGLTATANADGTTTLSWSAPSGTPVPEFYRIYRDGQSYTKRYDTLGASGATLSWTDTNTAGAAHDYRVTAVSAALSESDQTAVVTR